MIKISATCLKILVVVFLILTFSVQAQESWPIHKTIDLSNGFGDFRANRFHTGVDIRTGGKVGEKVYSPVDGYIYRIKMSYTGYGKGLYLKGDDGFIYVFGHLHEFEISLNNFIKQEQIKQKRYSLDIYLPEDSIRINKGSLIALAGQTGAGAPHLHFEKRSSENSPVNPLSHGFELSDKTPPVFKYIGFQMTDDKSLFDQGDRKQIYDVKKASNNKDYYIENVLFFNRPFGVVVNAFDLMRANGMKQSVYSLTYYVDDEVFYQAKFDSTNFDWQRQINLEYDIQSNSSRNKHFRRLFEKPGNVYPGSSSPNSSAGLYTRAKGIIGNHKGTIVAEDCFGNQSKLEFSFIWGPEDYIFSLDSVYTKDKLSYEYYFTNRQAHQKIDIDSVLVFYNIDDTWGQLAKTSYDFLDNGQIRININSTVSRNKVLKLGVYSHGALIKDNLFNGVLPRGKYKFEMTYEIVDDGLIMTLDAEQRAGSECKFDLYNGEELLGTIYPELFTKRIYKGFVPPLLKYQKITKIGYANSRGGNTKEYFLEDLNIYLVGHKDNQKIKVGGLTAEFDQETFYEPRFIEIIKSQLLNRGRLALSSNHFQILPEVFVCKNNYKISIGMRGGEIGKKFSGVGWLDKKKNSWVWLKTKRDGDLVTAESTGGGSFAAVIDNSPPVIANLSIIDGLTYSTSSPLISFSLIDSLSGFEDDRSILVRIDNEWLIPEYDPEGKRLITRPFKPLKSGQHHLGIEVVDRAGNVTEQYLKFFTRSGRR